MAGSFISALGGLRVHQSWIDVIGNNLANSSTPGFKSSRALFSDLLSVTYRPATGPSGSLGGTNPLQVGLGVQLARVDRRLGQGPLDATGRTFDLALLGRGYFAVTEGNQTLYTRVGAFGLDADGNLVDQRTGFQVLSPAGQPVSIDATPIAPSATTEMTLAGNLPAVVTGPLAEQLSSSSSFQQGSEVIMTGSVGGPFNIPAGETWTMELVVNGGAPEEVSIVGTGALTAQDVADAVNAQVDHLTASVDASQRVVLTDERTGAAATIKVTAGETGKDLKSMLGLIDFVQGENSDATLGSDLNLLSSNITDYEIGDEIDIVGSDVDGSPVSLSFTYGVDGTTIGELVQALDAAYGQSTVAFEEDTGQITISADVTGEAELSLSASDPSGQVGQTNWSQHFFAVTTNGTGPDQVTTSLEVFDSQGTSHILTLEFTRQDDSTWNLEASAPDGTISQGEITGITFNQNGSILTPTSGNLVVQFNGLESQTIALDMGTAGQFGGITQFGSDPSLIATFQDGFAAGELASLGVNERGVIEGFYTNGQTLELAEIGVASFANEAGLEEIGDNYFRESANSGARVLAGGQASGAGDVIGGALEGSNVDTAEEFVRLIEAQRGFQANARVITVQDEILSEIVNII